MKKNINGFLTIISLFCGFLHANSKDPCSSDRSFFPLMGFDVSYGLFTSMLHNATILKCSPKNRNDLGDICGKSGKSVTSGKDSLPYDRITALKVDSLIAGEYNDSTIIIKVNQGYFSNIDNLIYVFVQKDAVEKCFFAVGDTTFYEGFHVSIEQAIHIGALIIKGMKIGGLTYCDSIMSRRFEGIKRNFTK
jgi:hypothetical protein